jgi:septation ring formation regulator EzrA
MILDSATPRAIKQALSIICAEMGFYGRLTTQLLNEQFNHLKDSIESRFRRIEKELEHQNSLDAEKMNLIRDQLQHIRADVEDHEKRIRAIDDTVISNKTSATLIQAGQAALTLIASAIAAWLGGKQ